MLVPRSPEASQPKVTFLVQVVELRWITSLASQLRCRSISRCPCEREPSARHVAPSWLQGVGEKRADTPRPENLSKVFFIEILWVIFCFFFAAESSCLDCVGDLDS